MSEPCRCLESATDLSGLVNIEPTTIAVGGNATVRQGILRTNGIRVAVKAGRFLNDKQSYECAHREIRITASLEHENIIELLGYLIQESKIMMVTPWMDMGDASMFVKDTGVDPRPLLRGIADGICYLHYQNIFHGDLKGKNVLISQDYRPKIIDFGNASSPPVDAVHSLSGGSTLRWMAPEAIEQQGLATAKGDVWAFGMTALELFTRIEPFRDIAIRAIPSRIYRGPPDRPNGQSTHFRMTEEWWNICLACWNLDAEARPQMSVILNGIRMIQ